MVDVVHRTGNLLDAMTGAVRLGQEVRIDPNTRSPVHLVETSQPMKGLPIGQEKIGGTMAEQRRSEHRPDSLIRGILEDVPAHSRLIEAKLDVVSGSAIDGAVNEPLLCQRVHHRPSEQDVDVAHEHEWRRRAPDADVLGEVLQIEGTGILRQRRLVFRGDDDPAYGACGDLGKVRGQQIGQLRPARDRIPFDEDDFVGDAALR